MSTTDAISKQRNRNWAWFWLAYTGFLFIDPICACRLPWHLRRLYTGER
jgi:hypothetical protein